MKSILRLLITLTLLLTGFFLSRQAFSASAVISVWTCASVTWLMLELLFQHCTDSHSWKDESRATPIATPHRGAAARQRMAA